MKFKNWLILMVLFLFQGITAQIKDPVKFKYNINTLPNNEYEAVLTATIEKNWHIYSQDLPEDSGIPTEMKLSSKEGINLIGKVQEVGKKHDEFSEAFGAQIVYYSDKVLFKQKFKLKDNTKPANITAEITYQTCDDRVCLAPNTLEFEQKVTPAATAGDIATTSEEVITSEVSSENKDSLRTTEIEETTIAASVAAKQEGLKVASIDFANPQTDCGVVAKENTESFWTYLLLGFFGGLIALLTPCVFPMIPLTVSFFTKGSKDKAKGKRDAFIYGFFILLIFVLLSVPFHIIDGIAGNIFNQISTSV
ncbi:protein-disulfide reductase DsbD domain-containing protein, partial [Kaistella carnis]